MPAHGRTLGNATIAATVLEHVHGIPADRATLYAVAGLGIDEAIAHETDHTPDTLNSVRPLAALHT